MSDLKRNAIGRGRHLLLYPAAAIAIVAATAALLFAMIRKPALNAARTVFQTDQNAAIAAPWQGWATDLRSAAGADEDGKDILVEFTSGQDGAAALESVLQSRGFEDAAHGMVRVRLDVATSKSDPGTVERTAEWIDRLNLTDLPCLVSFDSALRPFGALKPGNATNLDSVIAWMHSAEAAKARRDADLGAAARATGVQRAKLLSQALDDVGPVAALAYPEVMRQIVQLDADGTAGVRSRYADQVSQTAVDDAIQHVVYPMVDAGDLRGALEQASRIDSSVATTVAQHQLLQAFQAQLYSSLGQKQKALALMDSAIALDPSTDAATRVRGEKEKIEQQRE